MKTVKLTSVCKIWCSSSVISILVEEAILQEKDSCPVEKARKVFWSILEAEGLDIRDKKAAIIDFIAAGITTVRKLKKISLPK